MFKNRRIISTCLLILTAAISFLFISPKLGAEETLPIPQSIQLDGYNYSRKILISLFDSVAFTTDTVRHQDLGGITLSPFDPNNKVIINSDSVKKSYPWLHAYLYPKEPSSKLLAVNKWVKPILISTGMPNDLDPFSDDPKDIKLFAESWSVNSEEKTSFEKSEKFLSLEKEIKNASEDLGNATNLKISYVSHAQETYQKFGNMRIIFVPDGYLLNDFRGSYRGLNMGVGQFSPLDFRFDIEPYLVSGLKFTAHNQKQVDGYIVTNTKNEIEMSFCYISEVLPIGLQTAAVRECILRSLGLVGTLRGFPKEKGMYMSYLSLWNEPEQWQKLYGGRKLPFPTHYSELDLYLLKLLYQPELQTGMDYTSIYKHLNVNK